MAELPSGTVTFLFTDIEGSTRLWQQGEAAMRAAMSRHDELLRKSVADHDGTVFSTMGDGIAAAFGSASTAVAAAVTAQSRLTAEEWPTVTPIRVRMGIHTGEAELRDGDYFGTSVNRTARLTAIGHGGQVLVSSATAELVGDAVLLVDLGEHRLRDLGRPMRVFQVGVDGSRVEFPPLRSLDVIPGNLPRQVTSFVGRDTEVAELVGLVRSHELVTLTGVGGVGKTRRAVQLAAEMASEFPDGVWLVELAPVGEPAAVAEAVATLFGVTARAGSSVAESVAEALSGRRVLVVVDNCEHVLDAAGDVVETILAHTRLVKVLATSREGLRVGAEHLWPVPSLGTDDGASPAAELFVERARAVVPGFSLDKPDDVVAVVEICRRLDGIALAIELAAARMVSMNPAEVRDLLDDRFRLLSGSRRGLERHQTLRHAVGWSYELLGDEERMVLDRCAVFAGGFDLAALVAVCEGLDQLSLLDVLDSLVRKSLVAVEQVLGHTRYGLLETIRQFAEEQLAAKGTIGEVRDRHARFFAAQAVAHWAIWDSPRQQLAIDWVEVEFANLRAGFRWAADQGDLETAAAISAHTAILGSQLQRGEPAGWAEEILGAATTAELGQLPRLYTAASFCLFSGRTESAIGYAHTALALEADPRYDGFEAGWSATLEASAQALAGQTERCVEIFTTLAAEPGFAHIYGSCGLLFMLPAVGRAEDAMAMAEETLNAARAYGNPHLIAYALYSYGVAFTTADPARALSVLREGLAYCRERRLVYLEGRCAQNAASLEAIYGDLEEALSLFDNAIDGFHRAGNVAQLADMLANLAAFFDRMGSAEVAATLWGASAKHPMDYLIDLPATVAHLRAVLGDTVFDQCAAAGAAMENADAVAYARHHIQQARSQAASPVPGGE